MYGCKKTSSLANNSSGGSTDSDTIPAAITPAGTPVGNLVTKTIGAAGGSITSEDGRIQLTIPSGALSANIDISIQGVTNTCPAGIGVAYDLMPNGTKFATPASLTFHYTDSDVNGTNPLLLYEVSQDSANEWEINQNDKDLDTIARTVSFDINHFSPHGIVPGLNLVGPKKTFKHSEVGGFQLQRWVRSATNKNRLIRSKPYDVNAGSWSVNDVAGGSNQDGLISVVPGGSDLAQYNAPSSIDKDRHIYISVESKEPEVINLKPKKVINLQDYKMVIQCQLIGDSLSFDVDVYATQTGISDIYPDVYHDEAKMVVNVKNNNVDIPEANIVNQKPTVTPTSWGDQETGPGYTWVPDISGLINIQSGTGFVGDLGNGIKEVAITLTAGPTINPQYTIHDPVLGTYSFGGTASEPWPPNVVFILKDSFQIWEVKQGWGYSITPRH